ncbi:SRPBCC family protein [Parapedobacter deserti]|uniref:SRPBCC family protein n=1 Tax=Parapedobacter deserti TaxID=1912957 RepID=A0ABV7JH94_9SPHI
MTVIDNQVVVNRPVAEVYGFLADCNNHQQLMPEEAYNWSSTRDTASFAIKNMAKLSIKVNNRNENSEVVFGPSEKVPFDVTLRWRVEPQGDHATLASLVVEAELNMMMKMLAAKPLQKLVDAQVGKLKEILEK